MYVVVVYDTLAVRDPRILRTCRKYLHHVQNSVFEGALSPAQLRRFRAAVEAIVDSGYDNVLVYTYPPGATPERQAWGRPDDGPTDIL